MTPDFSKWIERDGLNKRKHVQGPKPCGCGMTTIEAIQARATWETKKILLEKEAENEKENEKQNEK